MSASVDSIVPPRRASGPDTGTSPPRHKSSIRNLNALPAFFTFTRSQSSTATTELAEAENTPNLTAAHTPQPRSPFGFFKDSPPKHRPSLPAKLSLSATDGPLPHEEEGTQVPGRLLHLFHKTLHTYRTTRTSSLTVETLGVGGQSAPSSPRDSGSTQRVPNMRSLGDISESSSLPIIAMKAEDETESDEEEEEEAGGLARKTPPTIKILTSGIEDDKISNMSLTPATVEKAEKAKAYLSQHILHNAKRTAAQRLQERRRMLTWDPAAKLVQLKEDVCSIWARDISQLPVHADLPRLIRRIRITDERNGAVMFAGRPEVPLQLLVGELWQALIDLCALPEETKMNRESLLAKCHEHIIPDVEEATVVALGIKTLLADPEVSQSHAPGLSLAKGLNQCSVAPIVTHLKTTLGQELTYSGVPHSWAITVSQDHLTFNGRYAQWVVTLECAPDLSSVLDISFDVLRVGFAPTLRPYEISIIVEVFGRHGYNPRINHSSKRLSHNLSAFERARTVVYH